MSMCVIHRVKKIMDLVRRKRSNAFSFTEATNVDFYMKHCRDGMDPMRLVYVGIHRTQEEVLHSDSTWVFSPPALVKYMTVSVAH